MGNWFKALLFAGAGTSVVAWLAVPEMPELAPYAYAGLFLTLLASGLFVFSKDPRHLGLIMVLGLTWMFFLLPLLREQFEYLHTYVFDELNLKLSAQMTLAGMVAFAVGWFTANRHPPRPLLRNLERVALPARALGLAALGLSLLSLLSEVFRSELAGVTAGLGRALFLVDQLPMLALSVGLLAWLEGYRNRPLQVWLFGLFLPLQVLLVLSHTLFSKLYVILGPLFLLYMFKRLRVPFVWLALAVVLLAPAFLSRNSWRIEVGWDDDVPLHTRVVLGVNRYVESMDRRDSRVVTESGQIVTEARMNSLALLAHCVGVHDLGHQRFAYGESFWWLLLAPIPRIIFPWKPEIDSGGTQFGIAYGIKTANENYALNIPLMVEAFCNGGWGGILLINLFLGASYSFLFGLFRHGQSPASLVALATLLPALAMIENHASHVLGGAMQAAMFWFLLDRLIFTGGPSAGPKRPFAVREEHPPAPSPM